MTHAFDVRQALSPNFRLAEFTRSETATKHQLYNVPRDECDLANLKALAQKVLEPARTVLGRPLVITSGYRCGTLNRLIGGAGQSQHLYGEAADISLHGMPMVDAALSLAAQDDLPFDQLIYEIRTHNSRPPTEWIHISHKRLGGNRHEVLTICQNGGERHTRTGVKAVEAFLAQEAGAGTTEQEFTPSVETSRAEMATAHAAA